MSKLHITIGGMSILVSSRDGQSAEIALLNPDRNALLPSDRHIAVNHLPLLVARRSDVKKCIPLPAEFPLEGSVRPEWFGATTLSDLVGWSMQGADLRVHPHSIGSPTRLEHKPPQIEEGCNRMPSDWSSLDWVASADRMVPGLELAPEWRESPHVATRFLLGSGDLSGSTPLATNGGKIRIDFPSGVTQACTDAFVYRHPIPVSAQTEGGEETSPFGVLVVRSTERWLLQFERRGYDIPVWLLSLDDQADGAPDAGLEHFRIYSLLPWRFKVPKFGDPCSGAGHTDGPCINFAVITD